MSHAKLPPPPALADGALRVGGGEGTFRSQTFVVEADGSGWLTARGEVTVRGEATETRGSGRVAW